MNLGMPLPFQIPYLKLGKGPALHFAHANGYPPAAYLPLLKLFASSYEVFAMSARPLWTASNPDELVDWQPLVSDLETFLDFHALSNLVGVGHSLGGALTLHLALRRPDLFKALVLIDPVFLPPAQTFLLRSFLPPFLLEKFHPLVRSALRRKRRFASSEAMCENYRLKPVFSRLGETALQAYVHAMSDPLPDGSIQLAYPPEWEARIYSTAYRIDLPLWRQLSSLRMPVLFLGPSSPPSLLQNLLPHLRRRLPAAQIQLLPDCSHLLPLEDPERVNQIVMKFLENQSARL